MKSTDPYPSETQSSSSATLPKQRWLLVLIAGLLSVLGILTQRESRPEQSALRFAKEVAGKISGEQEGLLVDCFALPTVVSSSNAGEQEIYLRDVLHGELSEAGLTILSQEGDFGPLLEVFPETGNGWAEAAGVPIGECFAFKLERDGGIAELVLHQGKQGWRIVRCNNVNNGSAELTVRS